MVVNLRHHAADRMGHAMFDPSEMQRVEKLLLAMPPRILAHPGEANESSATSGSGPLADTDLLQNVSSPPKADIKSTDRKLWNSDQTARRCTTIEVSIRLPCFSLAWARKNAARAADIGIAGLFNVGIAVLVIDHDRFAACLAGMMMFRCGGRLD
jgi:hypothetical protein